MAGAGVAGRPARRLVPIARGHTCARLLSAALLLAATVDGALADNVVGAWESPAANNWPLIAVHAALTPDGRVLTYGTWSVINGQNNPAQQTGYFKYDIWDPATGLNGGHVTLDSARESDIFCSSQLILPQSGSIFIAGGDNWTGTGHDEHRQQQQQHLPSRRQHAVPGDSSRPTDTVQEHEPGAVVLVVHCAHKR